MSDEWADDQQEATEQVTAQVNNSKTLNQTISEYNRQNMSPGDIYDAVRNLPQTVGGIPGIGSRIPGLGKIPLPTSKLPSILTIPDRWRLGKARTWEPVQYSWDLNRFHPKFKFLFKVKFEEFGAEDQDANFYYFVQRCDKPRIRFNHVDVNFYNFRSRVLTSVTYEPLSITFLDDIGNKVNQFFQRYLQKHSGTGSGFEGRDTGFGASSSSLPYKNGKGGGGRIILEQIFANGTMANRFKFINPRIESFDFDELSMEDTMGSLMTVMFSYDAIECMTIEDPNSLVSYTWGKTDLLRGDVPNSYAKSLGQTGQFPRTDANGIGFGGPFDKMGGSIKQIGNDAYESLKSGVEMIQKVPGALSDLIDPAKKIVTDFTAGAEKAIGSGMSVVSRNIQDTLKNISSGANLKFGGSSPESSEPPDTGFHADDTTV